MISRANLIILACLMLTACSGIKARDQVDRLNNSLIQYGAALRWDRINMAYAFHVDRDGNQPSYDLDYMENFSVTDFRTVEPDVNNEEGTEATVPVEIDYYDERTGNLRKLKYTQIWWYREESRQWYTESPFPDFK